GRSVGEPRSGADHDHVQHLPHTDPPVSGPLVAGEAIVVFLHVLQNVRERLVLRIPLLLASVDELRFPIEIRVDVDHRALPGWLTTRQAEGRTRGSSTGLGRSTDGYPATDPGSRQSGREVTKFCGKQPSRISRR